MDGNNVLFDNTNTQQKPEQVPVQAPTPVAPQAPMPPQAVPEQPVLQQVGFSEQVPVEPTPPPPPARGGFFKKLMIGAIVVVVVIFLIFLLIPKDKNVKNVTLVWWGLWEDDSGVMQALIADFRKTHPNIDIEYSRRDSQQYRDFLVGRLSGNDKGVKKPDVFRYHNTWLPMFRDSLVPLPSDVITTEEFKKNYYPVMQSDLVENGAIYGIPLGTDCLALITNKKLFEAAGLQPPKNWIEFLNAAKKLTVVDENGKVTTAGAAMGTMSNVTHAPDIISLLLSVQGVDLKTFSGSNYSKAQAFTYYLSFAKKEQNLWNSSLDESKLAFAKGNLAMYIGFSWDIFDIKKLNKNIELEVNPMPELNKDAKGTIASYWVEGVSSKSLHKKEAFEFMHYLAQKETEQKFYTEAAKKRGFGEPYARVDLAESLKDDKIVYPFVSQMKNARSSYFASNTRDGDGGLNTSLNVYLSKAIDSIVIDNVGMETMLENLDAGIKQVFAKYGVQ